ncbi:MAG: hypothetical protein ACJ8EL_08300 [Rhizomicrobium sp.]
MILRNAAALLIAFLLAGCGTSAEDAALQKNPNFHAGYDDGCAAANTVGANPRESASPRDEELYNSDKAYHAGWGSGFSTCRNQMTGNQQLDNPLMNLTPGQH